MPSPARDEWRKAYDELGLADIPKSSTRFVARQASAMTEAVENPLGMFT